MAKWRKLKPIEGGHGGCLNCSFQPERLRMSDTISVGFGDATLMKGRKTIYYESLSDPHTMTVRQAEKLAAADPEHDWRIHLIGPLNERHYQRQGKNLWVLYKKGMGFA